MEKNLYEAVKNGDLPIKAFNLDEIESQYKIYKDIKNENESESKDIKPTFNIVEGIDALNLSETADENSIVQVASQFNALESVSKEPTEVKSWIYDNTQGPRAALQSVAAAKHREMAHIQNKLPDAIQGLLEKCILKDGKKITEKYKDLYLNGYLKIFTIDNVDDLKCLKEFLDKNIGDMNFLSQWVKCEKTEKKQLQVFAAAPNFSGSYIYWDRNNGDERINLLSEISKIFVESEYRAIARVAAIRSKLQNEPVSLHLTLVGQGVFFNPPKLVEYMVSALNDELSGSNVNVYLHGWHNHDCEKWRGALKSNNISYENLSRADYISKSNHSD